MCCVLYPFLILSLSLSLSYTFTAFVSLPSLSELQDGSILFKMFYDFDNWPGWAVPAQGQAKQSRGGGGGGPPSCRICRQQRRMLGILRQLPNKRNMSTTSCHLLLCCLPLAPPATCHQPVATCLICAFECFVFTHAHDNARAAPRWPWQERAKEILSEKHNALRTWKPFVKHATVAVAISRWCYLLLLLLQLTSLPARQNGANAPQPVTVEVPLGVQRALGILRIVLPATAPCGRVPPSWPH